MNKIPKEMNISPQGHELTISGEIIKKPEGKAYKCSVDTWTIWVGHANDNILINGTVDGEPYSDFHVVEGLEITPEEGWRIYEKDRKSHTHLLNRNVTVPLSQNQYDVLADLEFQIPAALQQGSDLLAALVGGKDDNGEWIGPNDYARAGAELLRWAGVPKDDGIYRRSVMRYCLWNNLPWRWVKYSPVSVVNLSTEAHDIWRLAKEQEIERPNPDFMLPQKESAPIKEAPPVSIPDKGPAKPRERIVIENIEEVKQPEIKTVSTPEPSKPPEFSMSSIPYGNVDTTADPKDALKSKRIWGLFIMIASRISFPFVGSITALNTVTQDPILFDAAAGGLAMGAIWLIDAGGQYLHKWGKDSATTLIK